MEEIKVTVPDMSDKLETASNLLKRSEKDYKWYRDNDKEMPLSKKKQLVYVVSTVLDAVGELSQPAFDVREKMEEDYNLKYLKSPALGKELFLKHYESLHKPYDKLKNKCFDLLNKIDPKGEIDVE